MTDDEHRAAERSALFARAVAAMHVAYAWSQVADRVRGFPGRTVTDGERRVQFVGTLPRKGDQIESHGVRVTVVWAKWSGAWEIGIQAEEWS